MKREDVALLLTALFAAIWIVHRGAVQAMTLDEANTFLFWVYPEAPTHWTAHPNNHILNSALMRLSVWLSGYSHLSLRAPAILGGWIYIATSVALVRRLASPGAAIGRLALFVCLVFNPFCMDYLVAARGYALMLGFLAVAVLLTVRIWQGVDAATPIAPTVPLLLSASVALSFSANFSSAYANAFVWAAAFLGLTRRLAQPPPHLASSPALNLAPDAAPYLVSNLSPGLLPFLGLAALMILPAATIVAVLCGKALLAYSRDHLIWGTDSVSKMILEIRDSIFDRPNPALVSPSLMTPFNFLRTQIVWPLAALLLMGAVWVRKRYAWVLAGAFALTFLAHWLQFRISGVLLPFERTALAIVYLLIVVVGAFALALPRRPRKAAVSILCIFAIYFAACIRDTYFREWTICADIERAIPTVLAECRRASTREVVSDLNYTPSLNYYRTRDRISEFQEVANHDQPPPGKSVYILPMDLYADFIRAQGLTLRFRGAHSDIAVLSR
jgi:hypothetical protein